MSDIYRAAESVTVWLGRCPQLLSSGVARLEAAQGDLVSIQEEDRRLGKTEMLGDDSERYAFIGAAYLLSRRWFGRLWVLQEFCLARQIDIQFGEHHIRPETVVGLIQSFKDLLEGNKEGKGRKSEAGITNGEFSSSSSASMTATANVGCSVFRPFWGLHIKFVPVLLDSRDFFQQGMKWSLEDWLRLTRGRSASDNRDFVNAGLALVREASLTIDQSMQLEDAFPSSQSGPRLWPCLRATSGVDKFEVMLNLAACLLTQSQSVFILSIASLGNDSHLPSWVPDPGTQADSTVEPFTFLKGTNFGACVTSLATPKISPDGRTLYLQAARLGTIEHLLKRKVPTAVELIDFESDMVSLLEFVLKIPPEYGPSQESGLDALARTLIADSLMDGDPVMGLTGYLTTKVFQFRRKLNEIINPTPPPGGVEGYIVRKANARKDRPSPEEAKELIARLDEAWSKLKSIYPDKPWSAKEAKTTKELSNDHRNFLSIAVKVNGWRTLFLTHEGQLGLTGAWVEEGKVVMLVESGYVPYVFGSAEEQTRAHVKSVRKELEGLVNEPQPQPLSKEKKDKQASVTAHLDFLQGRVGKQGGVWSLYGEAYVHGFMHGEGMDGSRAFEPIAID